MQLENLKKEYEHLTEAIQSLVTKTDSLITNFKNYVYEFTKNKAYTEKTRDIEEILFLTNRVKSQLNLTLEDIKNITFYESVFSQDNRDSDYCEFDDMSDDFEKLDNPNIVIEDKDIFVPKGSTIFDGKGKMSFYDF